MRYNLIFLNEYIGIFNLPNDLNNENMLNETLLDVIGAYMETKYKKSIFDYAADIIGEDERLNTSINFMCDKNTFNSETPKDCYDICINQISLDILCVTKDDIVTLRKNVATMDLFLNLLDTALVMIRMIHELSTEDYTPENIEALRDNFNIISATQDGKIPIHFFNKKIYALEADGITNNKFKELANNVINEHIFNMLEKWSKRYSANKKYECVFYPTESSDMYIKHKVHTAFNNGYVNVHTVEIVLYFKLNSKFYGIGAETSNTRSYNKTLNAITVLSDLIVATTEADRTIENIQRLAEPLLSRSSKKKAV